MNPLVEEAGRVATSQIGKANASVRGGVVRNLFKSVNEDMSCDLHAVRHVGVVVATGVMFARLVGASLEFAAGSGSPPSRTDVCFKDQALSLPGTEALLFQVYFCTFVYKDHPERASGRRYLEAFFLFFMGHGSPCLGKGLEADQDGAIGKGAHCISREALAIQDDGSLFIIDPRRPSKFS